MGGCDVVDGVGELSLEDGTDYVALEFVCLCRDGSDGADFLNIKGNKLFE